MLELLFQKWRHVELEFDIDTNARFDEPSTDGLCSASVSPPSAVISYSGYRAQLNRIFDISAKNVSQIVEL